MSPGEGRMSRVLSPIFDHPHVARRYQAAAGSYAPARGVARAAAEELWSIHEPSRVARHDRNRARGCGGWQRGALAARLDQRHLSGAAIAPRAGPCVPRLQPWFYGRKLRSVRESFSPSWRPRMIASARSTLRHPGITSCLRYGSPATAALEDYVGLMYRLASSDSPKGRCLQTSFSQS